MYVLSSSLLYNSLFISFCCCSCCCSLPHSTPKQHLHRQQWQDLCNQIANNVPQQDVNAKIITRMTSNRNKYDKFSVIKLARSSSVMASNSSTVLFALTVMLNFILVVVTATNQNSDNIRSLNLKLPVLFGLSVHFAHKKGPQCAYNL